MQVGADVLVDLLAKQLDLVLQQGTTTALWLRPGISTDTLLQDEIELFCKRKNEDMCTKLHPKMPCRSWHRSYGAVPDAMSTMPINDNILCKRLPVWPGGLGKPALLGITLRHAARPRLLCTTGM